MPAKSKAKLKLKIGDAVTWTSHGRGVTRKKRGTIVARVTAGKELKIKRALQDARPMFASSGPKPFDSFLVLVEQTGHKGKSLTPQLYWPRPELLKAR